MEDWQDKDYIQKMNETSARATGPEQISVYFSQKADLRMEQEEGPELMAAATVSSSSLLTPTPTTPCPLPEVGQGGHISLCCLGRSSCFHELTPTKLVSTVPFPPLQIQHLLNS